MQVRKNQVPGGGIKIEYNCARVENASTEKASTNMQIWKMQVRKNEVGASIDRWRNHRWIALRCETDITKQTCELKK